MSVNSKVAVTAESRRLAKRAGLRHVASDKPGYTRQPNGSGFKFLNSRGQRVRNATLVNRFESLAIPPAWTDVWICPLAKGHLQAVGYDDRNRKQYLYHERWRETTNVAKFQRLELLPSLLPKLRNKIARDLRGRKLTRQRVLAGMVALLDATSIRVGNEEYVRENNSYGLTTLRTRHVNNRNKHIELHFRAKSGLQREVVVKDKKLVRLMKELKELPGQHVFQFLSDEGQICRADSAAVNEYLCEQTDLPFTAKDFRTWKASTLVAAVLREHLSTETLQDRKKIIKMAIAVAAEALGNTTATCRKYYIHPDLLLSFEQGELAKWIGKARPRPHDGLSPEEQILARFLIRRARKPREAKAE